MFENFIIESDLQATYPLISAWAAKLSNYPAAQLKQAGDFIIPDLLSRKKTEAGKIMIPAYLSSTVEPYKVTLTDSFVGNAYSFSRTNALKRFVIDKISATVGTTEKIYLDGSLDGTNWYEGIASITLTAGAGKLSTTFTGTYNYYRYNAVKTTTLNLVARIYLVETSFDYLIIQRTCGIVSASLNGEYFQTESKKCFDNYEKALLDLDYSYDYNDSQSIEDGERKYSGIKIYL
jgi:hypothetical protein